MDDKYNGFILTSDSLDVDGKCLLKFGGISNNGPFDIRITNFRPCFFIERETKLPSTFPSCERKKVNLRSFSESSVDALYFNTQSALYEGKDLLAKEGTRTFEADIRPTDRFLMERFINATIDFQGTPDKELQKQGLLVFNNPQMKRGQFSPDFKVMSLDIETGRKGELYSIGIHQQSSTSDHKLVYMVGDQQIENDFGLVLYPDEYSLLHAFIKVFNELDPDIIVGWHVVGFDLRFLERKYNHYKIPFGLGRDGSKIIIQERKGMGYFTSIYGRVVIDGPPAMRGAFYSFENFKLETVAQKILGHGKDITESNENKVEEIERRFRTDKLALAKYNLLDCTLVLDIFSKIGLLSLIEKRSKLSGLLMDKIGISTAAFDHFYLPKLHRKGIVAPNKLEFQRESTAGGLVLDPVPGIYEQVLVIDFKSLYPSIIRTFKIDPLSRLLNSKNPIRTPSGHKFSKTEHILPAFIDTLFEYRQKAKDDNDAPLSMAIKILMNSFYGVMGSTGSRFYHADLPGAITSTGQWIMREAMKIVDSEGFEVLYGDTDSLFVHLRSENKARVSDIGKKIVTRINRLLKEKTKRDYGVESVLEIQIDKYYRKFYLPTARDGQNGAKKRYAGLLIKNGEETLDIVGMEYVRSDWTKLAKDFQFELFKKLFNDDDIEPWIKQKIDDLKTDKLRDSLVYTKKLTKDPREYTGSVPAHAKAALMLNNQSRDSFDKTVSYVFTRRGPIPVQLDHADIDYDHYIQKQLRPIADSVLGLNNRCLEDLIAGDQLSLF